MLRLFLYLTFFGILSIFFPPTYLSFLTIGIIYLSFFFYDIEQYS